MHNWVIWPYCGPITFYLISSLNPYYIISSVKYCITEHIVCAAWQELLMQWKPYLLIFLWEVFLPVVFCCCFLVWFFQRCVAITLVLCTLYNIAWFLREMWMILNHLYPRRWFENEAAALCRFYLNIEYSFNICFLWLSSLILVLWIRMILQVYFPIALIFQK